MNSPIQLRKVCHPCFVFVLAAATGLFALPVKADMLELTNGDHYLGTVVSMTQSNLEFQSEIQGLVKLPRDKVAKITLHESAPLKQAAGARVAIRPVTPTAEPSTSAPTNQT